MGATTRRNELCLNTSSFLGLVTLVNRLNRDCANHRGPRGSEQHIARHTQQTRDLICLNCKSSVHRSAWPCFQKSCKVMFILQWALLLHSESPLSWQDLCRQLVFAYINALFVCTNDYMKNSYAPKISYLGIIACWKTRVWFFYCS